MDEKHISKITTAMAASTAHITSHGIQALRSTGEQRRECSVSLATGAVSGALHILAALLGKCSDDSASDAEAVTNDSVLFAALLAAISASVSHGTHGAPANAVVVDFAQDPSTYQTAIGMFEKLTGRSVDGVLNPTMIAYAKLQADQANSLLNAVCANRKPV